MGASMYLVGPSLAIFIVSIVMMILSILTVSMRTFVRLHIVRAFGWDDSLMLAALVCSISKSRKNTLLMIGASGIIPDIERVQLRQRNERGWPHQNRFYGL